MQRAESNAMRADAERAGADAADRLDSVDDFENRQLMARLRIVKPPWMPRCERTKPASQRPFMTFDK